MKRILMVLAAAAALLGFVRPAAAEMAVIVNKANPAASLTRTEMEMIYLGKKKMFENGAVIAPADLGAESAVRREFFSRILKKSDESYRLYWVRMIFSGKGHPPVAFRTDEEAARFVATNHGAIAFIDAANAVPGVKIIPIREED